ERFQDVLMCRSSSILLTTLTALAYSAEVLIPAERLFEFVIRIVARLDKFIIVDQRASASRYHIANPVNGQENFAEKWTRADYDAFIRWQTGLQRRMRAIADAKSQCVDALLTL